MKTDTAAKTAPKTNTASKADSAPKTEGENTVNTESTNTENTNTAPATTNENVVVGKPSSDVTMPDLSAQPKMKKTKYDFDALEIGQSIPVTGKTAKQLYGTCQAANRRYAVDTGETRPVKIKMKDAEGNVTEKDGTAPKMKQTRHFFAHDCDPATDPAKATVRIWRDA